MAYSAELYVHDLDRQAADALNQFPKFVKLLETGAFIFRSMGACSILLMNKTNCTI